MHTMSRPAQMLYAVCTLGSPCCMLYARCAHLLEELNIAAMASMTPYMGAWREAAVRLQPAAALCSDRVSTSTSSVSITALPLPPRGLHSLLCEFNSLFSVLLLHLSSSPCVLSSSSLPLSPSLTSFLQSFFSFLRRSLRWCLKSAFSSSSSAGTPSQPLVASSLQL